MKQVLAVVIGLALALAIGQAQEEKEPKAQVEALIREGLKAYQAGQHQVAIKQLQKASRTFSSSLRTSIMTMTLR